MKDLIEKGINDLRDIANLFEDWENYTDQSKEEKLLDEIVSTIDNYRYFLEKLKENKDAKFEVVDQGYNYMLGIRENVLHRM
ncbi:MAG: hypothetical protein ACFFG0_50385 [Candidatus Thorarchaeota archaeon]